MFEQILKLSLPLILGFGVIGAKAEPSKFDYKPDFEFELQQKHHLNDRIVNQNFRCVGGWVIIREYTLSWSGCQGGLPYACTETHQVVERCIGGNFVRVSDTVIDRDCDYTYDGTWCPVEDLPWSN